VCSSDLPISICNSAATYIEVRRKNDG